MLIGIPLFFALVIVTVLLLRQIDQAAKRNHAPFSIHLVDLFSLSFLVAIPLAVVSNMGLFETGVHAAAASLIPIALMVLIWWTTINAVSRAGICKFRWRAAVSLIVIPVCYIGNLSLVGLTVHLNSTSKADWKYWILEVFLISVLIASIGIVPLAIRSANAKWHPSKADNLDSMP